MFISKLEAGVMVEECDLSETLPGSFERRKFAEYEFELEIDFPADPLSFCQQQYGQGEYEVIFLPEQKDLPETDYTSKGGRKLLSRKGVVGLHRVQILLTRSMVDYGGETNAAYVKRFEELFTEGWKHATLVEGWTFASYLYSNADQFFADDILGKSAIVFCWQKYDVQAVSNSLELFSFDSGSFVFGWLLTERKKFRVHAFANYYRSSFADQCWKEGAGGIEEYPKQYHMFTKLV